MERREAQGSRAEGPRAPGPPPPQGTLGSRKLGAKAGPRQWSAQGRPTQALWRLPALFPHGETEKRERRAPNVSKQPAGGALAKYDAPLNAVRETRAAWN